MLIRLPRGLPRDQRGMETLEYALIAGLIAVVALLVYLELGRQQTLQTRLSDSTTDGDTFKDKPGNGGLPRPAVRVPALREG